MLFAPYCWQRLSFIVRTACGGANACEIRIFSMFFIVNNPSLFYSADNNMMQSSGGLPAIGFAIRRGGRASNLACLGIVYSPNYLFFAFLLP